MMPARILVADDDADIRMLLATTLEVEGFAVTQASNGEQAIATARRGQADALLLDILMPDLSGLVVLEQLRTDARTEHLPVLLLTALATADDAVSGLLAGADDYIRKPFVLAEVVARVRSAIRRADQQRSRNPLTGLPGNESILDEMNRRIASGRPTALLYVDLDNFKAYNDYYGFLRGDDVLQAVARLLMEVRDDMSQEMFVGHVGGDDFVVMAAPEHADEIAQRVCDAVDSMTPLLYDDVDRRAGGIVITDRAGQPRRYGIMTVSIGIAVNGDGEFAHSGEFVTVATEMKHVAKVAQTEGSRFAKDRRQRDPGDYEPGQSKFEVG